jgi:hypothetical protein
MIPTITAFERSPDGGMGLARDTRVRWALEEVRQPASPKASSPGPRNACRWSRTASANGWLSCRLALAKASGSMVPSAPAT